jgi:hypothetical protein
MVPILKLSGLLVLAMVLIGFRREIWLVMVVLTAALGLMYLTPPMDVLQAIRSALTRGSNLTIFAAIYLIVALSTAMRETGYLEMMISSLRRLVRDPRLALAVPPALIGLLPMPAGAMMTAPVVERMGKGIRLDRADLTFYNFWFRHIWEYSWPLYPGLILAASFTNFTIRDICVSQLPLVGFALLIGFVFLFLRVRGVRPEIRGSLRSALPFLKSIWPILLIVLLVIVLGVPLVIGLAAALLSFLVLTRTGPGRVLHLLWESFPGKILLLILTVLVFKEMLEVTGLMEQFPEALVRAHIPLLVPLFLVPFLVGFLTGVNHAFVGIGFPIFISILSNDLTLIFYAYLSGFAGGLLSPTHLCLAVTRAYYRADLLSVYKRLAPAVSILLVLGMLVVYLRGGF